MHYKIEPAHLRIKVETRLNGKLISSKDIVENPEILKYLPDNSIVQKEYLKVIAIAETNMLNYVLIVSENGIISNVDDE